MLGKQFSQFLALQRCKDCLVCDEQDDLPETARSVLFQFHGKEGLMGLTSEGHVLFPCMLALGKMSASHM